MKALAVVMVAVMAAGCSTGKFVTQHNRTYDSALVVRAHGGNSIELGIDLAKVGRGTMAAFAADPWGGTMAIGEDTAKAAVVYLLGDAALGGDQLEKLFGKDDDKNDPPPAPTTVNGDYYSTTGDNSPIYSQSTSEGDNEASTTTTSGKQ
jgi:hypothetical protein